MKAYKVLRREENTNSDSFASKLSLFEKLSSTAEEERGREKLQGSSRFLWGGDSRTERDSMTRDLNSSSSSYESFADSLNLSWTNKILKIIVDNH